MARCDEVLRRPDNLLPSHCREEPLARFCMLRQQAEKETDEPYLSQADFIAPAVSSMFRGGPLGVVSHDGGVLFGSFCIRGPRNLLQGLLDG